MGYVMISYVWQCVIICDNTFQNVTICCNVIYSCVMMHFNVEQCVTMCYKVWKFSVHFRGSIQMCAFPARQNVGPTTVFAFTQRMVRFVDCFTLDWNSSSSLSLLISSLSKSPSSLWSLHYIIIIIITFYSILRFKATDRRISSISLSLMCVTQNMELTP